MLANKINSHSRNRFFNSVEIGGPYNLLASCIVNIGNKIPVKHLNKHKIYFDATRQMDVFCVNLPHVSLNSKFKLCGTFEVQTIDLYNARI